MPSLDLSIRTFPIGKFLKTYLPNLKLSVSLPVFTLCKSYPGALCQHSFPNQGLVNVILHTYNPCTSAS